MTKTRILPNVPLNWNLPEEPVPVLWDGTELGTAALSVDDEGNVVADITLHGGEEEEWVASGIRMGLRAGPLDEVQRRARAAEVDDIWAKAVEVG